MAAFDVGALALGVRACDRAMLGRALTLIESTAPRHRPLAEELLLALAPHAGGATRVGITGAPGAGKSTFLEALGSRLTSRGSKVAVLAIDPSSERSGGSILGDKTRMANLSRDRLAFVRPSPSGRARGGVNRRTREALLVCEAAGFDVVIVETVGVGQSETAVADMVDTFVLLWLPSSGDELQGIKRGIVELADLVVVPKSDGERAASAIRAAHEMRAALRYLAPTLAGWMTPVINASAIEGRGIDEVWSAITAHRARLEETGELAARRGRQAVRAMWRAVEEELLARLREDRVKMERAAELEAEVAAGRVPSAIAAARLIEER